MLTIALIAGAGALALAASIVMTWASSRSPLWNMAFAAVLLVGLIFVLLATALVLTEWTLRW